MATTTFKNLKFKLVFSALGAGLTVLHAAVLHWLGYNWSIAFTDSLINNALLMATVLLINIILKFYIPQKNQYAYILSLCAMLTLVWFFVAKIIALFLVDKNAGYAVFVSQSAPVRLTIAFLVICCMALISVLVYTMQDQREIEKRKTEAERLSKEAELFKLRQQLQPHFLFNSLNSINALIVSQPQLARTMIQQLSDFLRGTLKKEDRQWASLTDELEHLQLYLEIEKVRFGHRLSTTIQDHTADMEMFLPAMLLQPIVENAIKFGLYDTTDNINISIDAKNENGMLVIQVTNPFDAGSSAPNKGTGFGLSSVQRRLYLVYARNDLLHTMIEGSLFITTIKIPQDAKSDHY
ncbi:MAG: histidine kinase [Ferruginibacter sp.]